MLHWTSGLDCFNANGFDAAFADREILKLFPFWEDIWDRLNSAQIPTYHKIGSVPFQSMTAFFHLRRKSLVKQRYYIGFSGCFLIDKLNKLQSQKQIEPVGLGSDVANMSTLMTIWWRQVDMLVLWLVKRKLVGYLRTSSSSATPERACVHALLSLVTQLVVSAFCVTRQYSVCNGDFSDRIQTLFLCSVPVEGQGRCPCNPGTLLLYLVQEKHKK